MLKIVIKIKKILILLIGMSMSQYLPYDNFEWMSEKEINEILIQLVKITKLGIC